MSNPVKTTGGIKAMTSGAKAGEFKAGPPAPRDMGKTRNQVAFAGGGQYVAGKPSERNMGKRGGAC